MDVTEAGIVNVVSGLPLNAAFPMEVTEGGDGDGCEAEVLIGVTVMAVNEGETARFLLTTVPSAALVVVIVEPSAVVVVSSNAFRVMTLPL